MKRAIFPGTFDPFTIGHFSVVQRALTFMDEVVIGIGINESKRTWFPTSKRLAMISKLYAGEPRIKVKSYTGLTVDLPKKNRRDSLYVVSVRSMISNMRRRLLILTGNWLE